jgi:hypothetical protein
MPDKEKTFKEIHGKTKVGKFLQEKAPDLLKTILGVAGGLIPGASGVTDAISNLIKSSDELDLEQKIIALDMLKVDLENVKSAREMQTKIATSKNSTQLAKNYVYYIASFWSVITAAYIFMITFFEVANTRAADTVLGFLLGTIIATIINYFFGSSQGSKAKAKELTKLKIN